VLLHFDHWLLSGLMAVLEWLAVWPVWEQPAPPLAATLLAVLGVLWLLLPRGFPGRWRGCACSCRRCSGRPRGRRRATPGWTCSMSAGAGGGRAHGPAHAALRHRAAVQRRVGRRSAHHRSLPAREWRRQLDALIVTHRDKDHSGGVVAVQEAVPIARTLSSVPELPGERCVAGQTWEWDGVRFTVLHPAAADYERKAARSNNMSCVLRIDNGLGRVLLTSDIEARDEQALLARRRACCAARYCWCRIMAAAPRRRRHSSPLLAPMK
jgi:competence protein ComEC